MSERRFVTEQDTPCPFRLARFGFRRIGEFRQPGPGELYIEPSEGPELQEHEPLILGACGQHVVRESRHIVVALSDEDKAFMETPQAALAALFGIDPFALKAELEKEQAGA